MKKYTQRNVETEARKLCIKLVTSPRYNKVENYGQKEKRKFLDDCEDYQAQGIALEIFNDYNL